MTRIPVKIENHHEAQDENGGVENNVRFIGPEEIVSMKMNPN